MNDRQATDAGADSVTIAQNNQEALREPMLEEAAAFAAELDAAVAVEQANLGERMVAGAVSGRLAAGAELEIPKRVRRRSTGALAVEGSAGLEVAVAAPDADRPWYASVRRRPELQPLPRRSGWLTAVPVADAPPANVSAQSRTEAPSRQVP